MFNKLKIMQQFTSRRFALKLKTGYFASELRTAFLFMPPTVRMGSFLQKLLEIYTDRLVGKTLI